MEDDAGGWLQDGEGDGGGGGEGGGELVGDHVEMFG